MCSSLEAQQARQQQLLIEAENLTDTAADRFPAPGRAGARCAVRAGRSDRHADRAPSPEITALVEAAKANRAERKALEIRVEGCRRSGDRGRKPAGCH